ncbi:hypothetical protein NHX12_023799 [Muraenolepis orangiensis]|uniref:Elongin-A n=1 Tax=Muraenolepis orangiensis TaxID=630683 RepID=A0A9Q0EPI3_9TELE|nr:hypothetical protein NHX12_023799 [Muraenolepis orangiensis]
MAEVLLDAVERLQARLSESVEPRKILKALRRLGELPMTVEILVDTGIGKAVNSFRKHELAGEVAKGLVAKWKKLVPQPSTDRPSISHSREPPHSQAPPRGPHEGSGGGHRRPRPPPAPPSPPPLRHKDAVRHGKLHKEPGKNQSQPGRGSHAEPMPKAPKHSRHAVLHEGKREKERGDREETKGDADDRPPAPKEPAATEEEGFESPTMSFESFLMYDAPTPVKKKKKPSSSSSSSSHSRPSHPSSSSSASSSHARTHPATAASSSSSSKPSKPSKSSKSNGTKSSRTSEMVSTPVAVTPEKRRRPNYRPLPSLDLMPLSPQRRKVPQANGEEDSGFTGKRFNSKMVVYSGTKTAYLPKMMTLYEQCIRVLQNNVDSIDEVGGVPYEILEPVLERCTPEQLYRIEQCNQVFMEESDELWTRHCQRDFKRSSPQEYESWREMYLRLHDEREERLRMLTQNISSAHANKPKGRQVKMAFVNSVAKPPRDVRRRQEKFGTVSTSTASSTAAAAPIKIRPGSSRSSLGAVTPGRDKPLVKKIAPMMAKTIKAFKNRFSRR